MGWKGCYENDSISSRFCSFDFNNLELGVLSRTARCNLQKLIKRSLQLDGNWNLFKIMQ